MPMDFKNLQLELGAVEARGGGRVPQEWPSQDILMAPYARILKGYHGN